MPVYSPVRMVRQKVRAQLADSSALGLNAQLIVACAAYNIPAVQFDFGSASKNVFESSINYQDTEIAGTAQPNLLLIYGKSATPFPPQKRTLNHRFSGVVSIAIDVYMGVRSERIQNFEDYGDSIEDAMVKTMNDLGNQGALGGAGTIYNLDMSSRRGPVSYDGENWVVPVQFTPTFEAYIF